MVSTTPISIIPTWMMHDGGGQPQHGTQILPPGQEPTGGRGGRAHLKGAGGGSRGKVARLREQPLREVEALGQLGDFRAQGVHVLLQRLGVAAAAGHFRIPAAHAAAVRVAEVARDHDDQIVEPPEAEPADGDGHEDTAVRLADVEAMGAERAEQRG